MSDDVRAFAPLGGPGRCETCGGLTHETADCPCFSCPDCGALSHHPADREHRYCARCKKFFPGGAPVGLGSPARAALQREQLQCRGCATPGLLHTCGAWNNRDP